MKSEAFGFLKFLLIIATVGSALLRAWILFVVLLILTIAVYYAQEYRKMYGQKKNDTEE